MNSKTIKLYDENAYETEFKARVISCEKNENGHIICILDRTLFFPEEGGQTPDRGELCAGEDAHANVLDVQIKDDVIRHMLDKEIPAGTEVTGKIDWHHRFSNMQQHTGEHVFSGIVNRRFGYDNVGFHLSDSVVTMDYSGQLSSEELSIVEREVNIAIYENRLIKAWYPDEDELKGIDYRSKKEIKGAVRIVEVEGYDVCACCAPHVRNTGEIGILKIITAQNYKGGTRVSILCGERAFDFLSGEHALLNTMAGELSTSWDQIPSILEKQKNEIGNLKAALSASMAKLLELQVAELPDSVKNVFLYAGAECDSGAVRRIVNRTVTERKGFCGLFWGDSDTGFKFIVGAPDGENANDVLAVLKSSLSVRGGGSPAMVQGSISDITEDRLRDALARLGEDI